MAKAATLPYFAYLKSGTCKSVGWREIIWSALFPHDREQLAIGLTNCTLVLNRDEFKFWSYVSISTHMKQSGSNALQH